jgi:hypothetical protein
MNRQVQVNTYKKLTFHQGADKLNMRQMVKLVKPQPQAYALMTNAKGHYDLRNLCRIGGTAMVIVPVLSHLRGEAPLWVVLGGGLALWGISVPLHQAYERRALEGAHLYNLSAAPLAARQKVNMQLGCKALTAPGQVAVPSLQVRIGL